MAKLTLLTHNNDLTSFNAEFLETVWLDYFDIEIYDPAKTYDKKRTIVIKGLFRDSSWANNLSDYKTIVDNLAELRTRNDTDNVKFITNENWFWYGESLWYLNLGYDNYIPDRTYEKLALMPMRRVDVYRNKLLEVMGPYLNDFIYSYVGKNVTLPDDLIENGEVFQRHFNPDWYNKTCFSLVAETSVFGRSMFVTEKTFKTFAHCHPFMVSGMPHTLKFLQDLGFQTFSELFDESYDKEPDFTKKLNQIVENVKSFQKIPYDKITLEKIQHNKNLFYNKNLVTQRIIKEIIEPILEYAET